MKKSNFAFTILLSGLLFSCGSEKSEKVVVEETKIAKPIASELDNKLKSNLERLFKSYLLKLQILKTK